jgi:hypothetical protein
MFTRRHDWTVSWTRWIIHWIIQSISNLSDVYCNIIFLSISTPPNQPLPNGNLVCIFSFPCALHVPPSSSSIQQQQYWVSRLITADYMAARSKAWTVFACSNTGIVGLNPIQGLDVCMPLFCVCVVLPVGGGLATGWSAVQGVPSSATECV